LPFRLRPRDTRLAPDLSRLCASVVECVSVLTETVSLHDNGGESLRQRAVEADAEAEEAMHAVLRELASALVTPVDRIDVFRLAAGVRDCSRAVLDVIELIDLFGGVDATDALVEQIQHVQLAADVMAGAVPRLIRARVFTEAWIELGRLRKQSAERHRRSFAELTAPPTVPDGPTHSARTMRLVQIENGLQAAMGCFDAVGNVLQSIVVKEG
jgi:hypothetical protein